MAPKPTAHAVGHIPTPLPGLRPSRAAGPWAMFRCPCRGLAPRADIRKRCLRHPRVKSALQTSCISETPLLSSHLPLGRGASFHAAGGIFEFRARGCHSEPFSVILSRAKDPYHYHYHFSLRVNSAKNPRILKPRRPFSQFTLSEMQRSFPFAHLRVRMTSERFRVTKMPG
jgi:hypothetical protein